MKAHQTMATLLAATTVVACAATPPDDELAKVTRAALADASRHSGDSSPTLEVVSAERVVWRDGSLGCPRPDRAYTQALVPGYRVVVRTRGGLLDYHAGLRGEPSLCPSDRAVDPLPEDGQR